MRYPEASLSYVYNNIDLPFLPVLCEMEEEGVLIDVGLLRDTEIAAQARIVQLEAALNHLAPGINLNSYPQLSDFMYSGLGYEEHPKLGSSTSKEALVRLRGNAFVDLLV